MSNKILISNKQKSEDFGITLKKIIKEGINATITYLGYKMGFEVSVLICDNKNIRILNRKYRGIDHATDVLSFPMLEFDDAGALTDSFACELGDIVISLEKAAEQAKEYGHSVEREVGFLTVHSMLHLFGYNHEEQKDRQKMREAEENILEKMGVER